MKIWDNHNPSTLILKYAKQLAQVNKLHQGHLLKMMPCMILTVLKPLLIQ